MSATQENFAVHREPVWRDRADFIVNAPLPEEARFEQLWCRRIADDEFEVSCIPFFLYDVELGSIVHTSARDGLTYVVDGVSARSGRYVFRVFFDRQMVAHRDSVMTELKNLGVLMERSSPNLIAIDAEDEAQAQIVADYLVEQEAAGRIIYETGRSA